MPHDFLIVHFLDKIYCQVETLLNFFCPSTSTDRNLLAAFICAPLWYIPGIARPAWVIDSADGQGHRWSTVGVSPNIVDASFEALVDAIRWKLVRDRVVPA